MTATKRITERTNTLGRGCRVDRENRCIHGVLICGTTSANGRDYPAEVFRRDFAKYEGRPVNCDHGREATVSRRCGWLTDVRPGPDGRPRGTLHLLESHPVYGQVMEAAERNPRLFGFSHVAICRTRPGPGGREVVESIESVESVDLVAEPATTKGLFEGRGVKTTLRAVIEAFRTRLGGAQQQRAARRLLLVCEDDAGVAGVMDTPVDTPDESEASDPNEAIDTAFKQAMHAQVDALLDESHTLAEFISRIRELYKSRARLLGRPGAESEADADSANAPGEAEESRRQWAAALVREALAAERPTSAGRDRLAPAHGAGTERTGNRPPTDAQAFAEWVQ